MNNQPAYTILLTVMILICSTDVEGASSPKTVELNRKLSEMSSLQISISNRIAVAQKARNKLQKQIDELVSEINQIQDRQHIKSYHAAMKFPRIHYNIELIRQLSAYVDQLNERMMYFHSGNETLIYLHQQVSDDLKLIRTLNDMEVDQLIHKINNVLDEYIPETEAYLITVENIRGDSYEKIWEKVTQTGYYLTY